MAMIRKDIKYFCKDYTKIENYDKAVADTSRMWHLHHRKGEEGYSKKDLRKMRLYYGCKPEELIFLTPSQHLSVHRKGKGRPPFTEEWRKKMSSAKKGRKKCKAFVEQRRKTALDMTKRCVEKLGADGEVLRLFGSVSEAARSVGLSQAMVSICCKRGCLGAGFRWRYAS